MHYNQFYYVRVQEWAGREGDNVMHNFEHGAKFALQTTSLKCTDIKVRHKFIISQIPLFGTNPYTKLPNIFNECYVFL